MIHSKRPLQVALVGIDGCGKTTVARRLGDPETVVLHTIHPDETVDGPFHELSQHLQNLSVTADRLRSPQLKVAAFYLLLRTYAPIVRFFTRSFAPHTILSDRHPLIDGLVYLPLYRRMAAASAARVPDWRGELEPDAVQAILAWAHRVEAEQDLWSLGHRLLSLQISSRDKLLVMLSGLLHATLPDVVIHLDLEVDEALHRMGERGQLGELHETATRLSLVRKEYEAVLGWLAHQPTAITVQRIDCGASRSVDEIAAEVTDRLGARMQIAAA
jgi:thymidylate kinase